MSRIYSSQLYNFFDFSKKFLTLKNIYFGQTVYATVFDEISNFKFQGILHIGHTYDSLLPYYVYPLLGG